MVCQKEKSCLAYDEVVLFVSEKMRTDSKHQKSSAIAAITGLIKKGVLSEKEDWLWVI